MAVTTDLSAAEDAVDISTWTAVHSVVTVNRPVEVVRGALRDYSKVAPVVPGVTQSENMGSNRIRLQVQIDGRREQWEVAVDEDVDGALAWSVWSGIDRVPLLGEITMRSAPGDRGTEVRARIAYDHSDTAAEFARLVRGDTPSMVLREAMWRLRSVIETGEVVRVEGQPSGRGPVQEGITERVWNLVRRGGRV